MSVDIAGEDKGLVGHLLSPLSEDLKAIMWGRVAVELEAVSVESPGFSRILVEPSRVGHLGKADSGVAECGVGFPETFVATEGGEAGVGSHAGTGTDEESIGVMDGVGSGFEVGDHESELLGTLSPRGADYSFFKNWTASAMT